MNRRRFLGTAASAGIATIAGCFRGRTTQFHQHRRGTVECAEGVSETADGVETGDERWSTVGYDPNRRGYVPDRLGPQGCPSVEWIWQYDDDIRGPGMHTSPLVVGDTVFLADETPRWKREGYEGAVVAIDATTGEERWRAPGTGEPEYTPTIADDVIYLPGRNHVQAIDLDAGEQLWHTSLVEGHRFDGHFRTAYEPAIVDGTVYTGTSFGTVYALDAATGEIEWTFAARGLTEAEYHVDGPEGISETFRTGHFEGHVAVADGIVYASSYDGRLYAIDVETGEEVWAQGRYSEIALWTSEGTKTVTTTSNPAPPAIHDGVVYTSTRNAGPVVAYDAATGEEEWVYDEFSFSESVSPAVTEETVFATGGTSSERMFLLALDRRTGEERWRARTRLPAQGPIVDESTVYLEHFGRLDAHDRATGELRWSLEMHHDSWARPALANGGIVTADVDGHVYGLW